MKWETRSYCLLSVLYCLLSVLYQLDIYVEKKDLDNHLMLHMKVSSRVRHNNHQSSIIKKQFKKSIHQSHQAHFSAHSVCVSSNSSVGPKDQNILIISGKPCSRQHLLTRTQKTITVKIIDILQVKIINFCSYNLPS